MMLITGCNIQAALDDAIDPTYRCQTQSHLSGRINFTAAVPPSLTAPIIVQYSTDGFATAQLGQTITDNPQGLLSIPFDITTAVIAECPMTDGAVFQIRAFQDTNGDGTWESGEGAVVMMELQTAIRLTKCARSQINILMSRVSTFTSILRVANELQNTFVAPTLRGFDAGYFRPS